jgi:hypothetical protein
MPSRPRDVILFVIGGTTYEEARSIAIVNSQDHAGPGQGARFLLGGTTVHNSSSFLDMIQDAAARFPSTITRPPTSFGSGASLNLNVGPVQTNGGAAPSSSAPGTARASTDSSSRLPTAFAAPGGLLDPGRMGEAAENARELASGIFGRLRGAVDNISLQ